MDGGSGNLANPIDPESSSFYGNLLAALSPQFFKNSIHNANNIDLSSCLKPLVSWTIPLNETSHYGCPIGQNIAYSFPDKMSGVENSEERLKRMRC